MPLPKFKKLEEIPEAFRSEYEEKDGEWVPKTIEADTSAIDDIKKALDKERKLRDDADKAAKALQKRIDTEEQKRKAGEVGLTDKQLEELRAQVRADLEKEYAPFRESSEKSSSELRTLRLDQRIKTAMATKEVGVRAERFDALWKLIKDDFDLTEDGSPIVKAHPGLKVEQYLADNVKKLYGEFYAGSQASGGGASGLTGGKPNTAMTFEDLSKNPAAALQAARSNGTSE